MKFSGPGKRVGKAYYYEEDGHIWSVGYFKNGKPDSVWIKLDKKGNITKKWTYRSGEIVSK